MARFMSEGFLSWINRMPLAAVDELSDGGDPPSKAPLKETPGEETVTKAKPKPKVKATPKSTPKAKGESKAKPKPKPKPKRKKKSKGAKGDSKVEKEVEKPKKTLPVLKRPAAAAHEKTVSKCYYKASSSYGYKMDGRQVWSAPGLDYQSWGCHTKTSSVFIAPNQSMCFHVPALRAEFITDSRLSDETNEEISDPWLKI